MTYAPRPCSWLAAAGCYDTRTLVVTVRLAGSLAILLQAAMHGRGTAPALILACLVPFVSACTTAMDCSLGGECVQGACQCDKTWTGPTCAALNLLPANRSEGMHQPSYATWGGLPVEEDGQFHLFFADFTLHCGLGTWGTNSQVARAVSDHPAGPYKKVEVIAEPFHHNPTVAKAPDGTLLMVSIGNGSAGAAWPNGSAIAAPDKQRNCTGAAPTGEVASGQQQSDSVGLDDSLGDPDLGGVITTRYSKSVKGPWARLPGVAVAPGLPGSWDDFIVSATTTVYVH